MSVRPFGLLFALATWAVAIGLPGCATKTPEEARADLEKLKQKEKPKENFEALQAVTEPNELTFVKKDTKKDADQKKEDEILTRMIKPGHWTGVLVTTTANNFDFGGELSSEAHNSSQQPIDLEGSSFRLTTARPAALPKEQRKTLETIFFAPAAAGRTTSWMFNQLRNRQRGTEEYRGSELFQHMPSYQYFLFVLAKDATRYRYFKVLDSVRPPLEMPTVIVDDQNYYRVLTPRPEAPLALPTRALAWTNTAYFVWDDVLPEVLSPEQQQAMLDWLHWGGGLIISGPRTLDSLRGSFLEPYLPATGAQTASFDEKALAELNAHWSVGGTGAEGSALVAAEPWSGIKLEKHPEAEFVPGTGELVVERRVGRGRIVVTAFRLSERELIAWPSFDSFVNGCLLHRLPRRFSQATKQLDFLTRARQPVVDSFDAELVTGLRYFCATRRSGRKTHCPPTRKSPRRSCRSRRGWQMRRGHSRRASTFRPIGKRPIGWN